jgi:hypothetical protein
VDTDVYWAQLSLPAERLQWLTIPQEAGDPGSPALVNYRDGKVRRGRVLRLLADLTAEGRMARLLVAIPDPLDRQGPAPRQPPLLLGEYIRVIIEGETLPSVFRLPRKALHNDREVWLLDDDNRLEIRPVATVWRDEETVVIREGLQSGERLIVSELATPVSGMLLRPEITSEAAGTAPAGQAEISPDQRP